MAILKSFFDKFMHQSLRFQFLLVVASLLVIPVLAMFYDIFFASKSDEVMILDHQERLSSIVETRIVPGIQGSLNKRWKEDNTGSKSPETLAVFLREAFSEVAEPLVVSFPGVRFGLYLPESKQIYVHGFLHQYRHLSPDEVLEREKRILNEADSGLVAVVASRRPLARLTSSLKDETFEYLTPVFMDGKLVAVAWADERLHPIFAQSRSFRMVSRYIILLVIFIGAIGALLVIHNLTSSVSSIKKGLKEMERDLTKLLPDLPGEAGQMAQAINKMAISLAEKERLELEMQRAEKLASLGRLVTGVAHELRNPIGVVKAAVQVMENEYSSNVPGIEDFIKVIKEQVDRQNRVIQELLDFGRPSKQMTQPVDINSLLEKVLTFTSPMLRQNNIYLDVNYDPGLPRITVDTSRIKQVFVNMILNAVQAMPDGGKLIINTCLQDGFICTEFIDTGKGIEPDELSRIFDPFYTTKESGTGLGLSISHQIVKSHNGAIHVTSTPGEGTVFRVELPLKTDQGGSNYDSQDTDH
ncbi:MAG: two-component sensor histidine kinase [Peptococcaceae bacterium]|nr:two-component sensor histidine kinase [Peptococcaceae bacterium]